MRYYVAVLRGCLGPFALVRAARGRFQDAFSTWQRPELCRAVADLFGSVPVAFIAREDHGFKFDAPNDIINDVGLILEDFQSRSITWQDLILQPPRPTLRQGPAIAA